MLGDIVKCIAGAMQKLHSLRGPKKERNCFLDTAKKCKQYVWQSSVIVDPWELEMEQLFDLLMII